MLRSVLHVIQMDGGHRIGALLTHQGQGIRGADGTLGVAGGLGLPQGPAPHHQMTAHNHPARGGEAGDAHRHILRPQEIQEGIGLPAQVAPEGAVDALGIVQNLRPRQKLQGLTHPGIGLLRRDGSAVRGEHQAVTPGQGGCLIHGGTQEGKGIKSVLLQQDAGGVGTGEIVCHDDTSGHGFRLLTILSFRGTVYHANSESGEAPNQTASVSLRLSFTACS